MALPVISPLMRALQDAQSEWTSIKSSAQRSITELAAGNVSADDILGIHRRAVSSDAKLATLAATPGLGDYAKAQFNNAGYDIAADFTALRNALQAVRDSIESTIPKDDGATPYFLVHRFVSNAVVARTFTPAQTASLRTLLQTVVDAVA